MQRAAAAVDQANVRRRTALTLALLACGPPTPLVADDDGPPERLDLGLPEPTWTTVAQPEGSGGGGPGGDDPSPTGPPGPHTGTGSGATTSGPGTTGDVPAPPLRLTELATDPDGKDGGPQSPEFVELINVGPLPVSLDGLALQARTWPDLTAEDLGLSGVMLAPLQVLVIERYAEAADVPPGLPHTDGPFVRAAFSAGGGLRNADGGVLLGGDTDLVIYGAPQGPPYDDPASWTGPPAPAPGGGRTLCRHDPLVDGDGPDDWSECTPTPGELPAPDDGGSTATGTSSGTPASPQTTTTDTSSSSAGVSSSAWTSSISSTSSSASTSSTSTGPTTTEATTSNATSTDGPTTADTGSTAPPRVAIVEVLSNPPGPASGEKALEYVEVLNLGPDVAELAGWVVADDPAPNAPGTDPLIAVSDVRWCGSPTCLGPGERALIVGEAYEGESADALVLFTDDTTIADAGLTTSEPVVVRDASGAIVSTYRVWDDPKAEPYPIADERPVMRVDPSAPDEPASWALGTATPGS